MPRYILTRFGAIPVGKPDHPGQPDIELPDWLVYTILVIVVPLMLWVAM